MLPYLKHWGLIIGALGVIVGGASSTQASLVEAVSPIHLLHPTHRITLVSGVADLREDLSVATDILESYQKLPDLGTKSGYLRYLARALIAATVPVGPDVNIDELPDCEVDLVSVWQVADRFFTIQYQAGYPEFFVGALHKLKRAHNMAGEYVEALCELLGDKTLSEDMLNLISYGLYYVIKTYPHVTICAETISRIRVFDHEGIRRFLSARDCKAKRLPFCWEWFIKYDETRLKNAVTDGLAFFNLLRVENQTWDTLQIILKLFILGNDRVDCEEFIEVLEGALNRLPSNSQTQSSRISLADGLLTSEDWLAIAEGISEIFEEGSLHLQELENMIAILSRMNTYDITFHLMNIRENALGLSFALDPDSDSDLMYVQTLLNALWIPRVRDAELRAQYESSDASPLDLMAQVLVTLGDQGEVLDSPRARGQGIAFQVHDYFDDIDIDGLRAALCVRPLWTPDPPLSRESALITIHDLIDRHAPPDLADSWKEAVSEGYDTDCPAPIVEDLILALRYVQGQESDAITKQWLIAFAHDSAHAYEGDANLSCIQGIRERAILGIKPVAISAGDTEILSFFVTAEAQETLLNLEIFCNLYIQQDGVYRVWDFISETTKDQLITAFTNLIGPDREPLDTDTLLDALKNSWMETVLADLHNRAAVLGVPEEVITTFEATHLEANADNIDFDLVLAQALRQAFLTPPDDTPAEEEDPASSAG